MSRWKKTPPVSAGANRTAGTSARRRAATWTDRRPVMRGSHRHRGAEERDPHLHVRAATRRAAHGDVASMLADDLVDDGQAEAGSHRRARLEGIEHTALLLGADPSPLVSAGEHQHVPAHEDADLQHAAARHGLE